MKRLIDLWRLACLRTEVWMLCRRLERHLSRSEDKHIERDLLLTGFQLRESGNVRTYTRGEIQFEVVDNRKQQGG